MRLENKKLTNDLNAITQPSNRDGPSFTTAMNGQTVPSQGS